MRICRIVDNFPSRSQVFHGLAPNFYHISREQVGLGNSVDVICKRVGNQRESEIIEGVKVRRVPFPFNFNALMEIKRLSRTCPLHIVHSHATACFLYSLAKRYIGGQRYVVHVHGTSRGILKAYDRYAKSLKKSIPLSHILWTEIAFARQEISWKRADALIAVSARVANDLVDYYRVSRDRVFVVTNGVDLRLFYPRFEERTRVRGGLRIREDVPVILYLGGFRLVKGPLMLLESMQRVLKEIPEAVLIFVGDPQNPLERPYVEIIRNLVKALNLEASIRIVRRVPHEDLPYYYSASDALAIPSIYEGFTKVAFEATACGVPVVRTEAVSSEYSDLILGPDQTVPIQDPRRFGEELIEVLRKEAHTASMEDIRNRIAANLTWSRIAQRVQEVYETLYQ